MALKDAKVGGRNIYACGAVSPYVWAGQSVRGLEKAGSFSLFIFEVFFFFFLLYDSNDFITAVRNGGRLYAGAGGVYVCEVGWGSRDHLEFFSITL